MKRLKERLKNRLGESLAETLVALLIAALAVMMLAAAIVSAARINAGLKNEDVAFRKAQTPTSSSVSLTMDNGTPVSVTVNVYETQNDYVYYEYAD